MSQSDMARQLQVAPLTVNNWVNGRNKPRGRNLQKVTRFLSSSSGRISDHFLSTRRHQRIPQSLSFQGGKLHQELQRKLCELGNVMDFEVLTNRDLGGGHRPDVLWYKLNPNIQPHAQPKYVFEIELGQAIQKSLATLKHAYDLGNADLFLLVPEAKRGIVQAKVGGAFHEIAKKLKVLPVEDFPKDIGALKTLLGVST